MKELDERKAKVCREETAEPIYDVIEYFIKSGKVVKEWKRVDIMSYLYI